MKPTVTRGATHNFQKPANWTDEDGQCGDLQVRAETFGPNEIVELFSTWSPSPEERALIAAGGVIEVGLCLPNQPVMCVGVVEPVDPALIKYVSHEGAVVVHEGETSFWADREPLTINEAAHGDD